MCGYLWALLPALLRLSRVQGAVLLDLGCISSCWLCLLAVPGSGDQAGGYYEAPSAARDLVSCVGLAGKDYGVGVASSQQLQPWLLSWGDSGQAPLSGSSPFLAGDVVGTSSYSISTRF